MKHGTKRKQWNRTPITVAGAFVLSLLGFGLIMLLPLVAAYMTPEEVPEEVLGERGVERSTWIVFRDGDALTGMVKVITDTRTMTVSVVGYPPQTEIIDGVRLTTAEALYPTLGERVVTKIEELPVLSLPITGAAALIGSVSGNLPLALPQMVGSLPAGEVTLTPLQAGDVLTFDGWEQGGVGQAWAHAQLTAAFFRRVLTDTLNLDAAFGELAAVCDTRLNVSQLEAIRGEWEALCLCAIEARVAAGYMTGVKENQRYVCK